MLVKKIILPIGCQLSYLGIEVFFHRVQIKQDSVLSKRIPVPEKEVPDPQPCI
jgi:hypothetical protein